MHKIYNLILICMPIILISIISGSVYIYSPKNMDHVVRFENPKIKSSGSYITSTKKITPNLLQEDLTHYNSEQKKFPNQKKHFTTSADVSKIINSGIIALESEKPETALFYLNNAIKLAPKRENAYYQRARTYYHLNRDSEALEDINKAITKNSKKSEFYSLRAKIFWRNENFPPAISDVSKSIELNPQNSSLYLQRGILFSLTNNPYNALFDYSQAINLNPNMSSAFYQRALLLEKLNEIVLAEYDYKQAKKLELETK